MGYENNASFQAAAADARALHDGAVDITSQVNATIGAPTIDAPKLDDGAVTDDLLSSTNGSPIGAAAAEEAEKFSDPEPWATVNGVATPIADMPPIMQAVIGVAIAQAEAAAKAQAQANAEEMIEDATDRFALAQKLTAMSAGAESMADLLEIEGSEAIAELVRAGAKNVRKAAKLARQEAREALVVLDTE